MDLLTSLRLTAQLNALAAGATSLARAEPAVTGADVAHHVVDPDAVLGLDPLRATGLVEALPRLAAVPGPWVLALPAPGNLGVLRGPVPFNQAALEVGSAVVPGAGGPALVPFRVGPGVQWRVFAANPPAPSPSPSEAERMLSQAIAAAARTLTALDVASGTRPRLDAAFTLAPGYPPRQVATADRAARLMIACEAALADSGRSITAFEVDIRARELRTVEAAAREALCAATAWRG